MTTILGPEKSFSALLDEAILKKAIEPQDKSAYPLRPSAAGYCGRKLAHDLYAWEGHAPKAPDNKKPNVHRLLDLGHSVEYHALSQFRALSDYSIRFKQQTVSIFKLPSGRLIEGAVDGVLWSDQHRGVLDVKSVGNGWSAAFASRWDEDHSRLSRLKSVKQFDETGFWIEDPIEFFNEVGEHTLVSNICQINLYTLSDFMRERGITFGSVYRYEKNSSKHVEVRFKPSEALFEYIKIKYGQIEAAVKEKDPARIEREYVLGSMACAYCPYQQQCWPGATKRDAMSGLPPKKWAESITRLRNAEGLKTLFEQYQAALCSSDLAHLVEAQILKEMTTAGVEKLKLETGEVYEIVRLKSPKPHLELRRGKE